MKKTFIVIGCFISFFAFSQKTKKKIVKPKAKTTTVKKTGIVGNKTDSVAVVPATILQTEKIEPIQQEQKNDEAEYEATATKILKKGGWIKNRNSAEVRGIEGFVKGVYIANKKIYLLLEIDNRTNINYDIESISFITSPIITKNRQLEAEEKTFVPIWSNQPENLAKKKSTKLVYVFDKFTIADNKNLLFIMNEIDGERTLTLEIKPKYIIESEYIK